MRHLRIATRRSPLAVIQSNIFIKALQYIFPQITTELIIVDSVGDKHTDKCTSSFLQTGIFIKEIRELLKSNKADIAIHSYKDVPTKEDGFSELSILERGSARDILIISPKKISSKDDFLQKLPPNLVIGTCSPRRKLQILQYRSDFKIIPVRGNIQTRLLKLTKDICDGILLSEVSLHRLNIFSESENVYVFPPDEMVPAAGQGAILVECLAERADEFLFLKKINHKQTHFCTKIERYFLKEFQIGCMHPFGIYARKVTEILTEIFFFFARDPVIYHKEIFVVENKNIEKELIFHVKRLKNICSQKGIYSR